MTAYFYVQDNGTQAWTDDPERVPARYQLHRGENPLGLSERVEIGTIWDYPRTSIVVSSEDDQED